MRRMPRGHALFLIDQERDKQDAKWGVQHHDPEVWHVILSEEVGEVAEEILKLRQCIVDDEPAFADVARELLKEELVQVAAVCVAALEDLGGH